MSSIPTQPVGAAAPGELDNTRPCAGADVVSAAPGATAPAGSGDFVRHARTVSILTFVSRMTGLGRDAINSRAIGQTSIADAWWYGFQVPNLFRRLFGEGALTAAFLPVYTDLLHKDRQLAGRFASLCVLLLTVVLGLITLGGELVLWYLLRRSAGSPDVAMTWRLTMIMFPYMILVCLVALFGTILQVHGRFAPSAAQPILLNLFNIGAFAWIMVAASGRGPEALRRSLPLAAWSVVAAGICQCLTQGAMMLRHQRLTLRFAGTGPALRAMLRPFLPMFLALSVFQLNTWVDANLADFLSPKVGGPHALHLLGRVISLPLQPGSLAAVMRTQLLYQFPLGVFGISIATAVFPALAHAATEEGGAGRQRFCTILREGLRLTVFIGLPASVGLLLLRLPVCRVVFEGGMFHTKDSQLCAHILAAYAPAIWAYAMFHVLTRGFFALKDSRTPMTVSVCMVALNFLLNITLVWHLGIVTLALSTAVCAVIQCGVMLLLIRRKVDRPIDRSVLTSWGRTALLSALMAAVIGPIAYFWRPSGVGGSAASLAVLVALGAAIFLGGALALGCEELAWIKKRRVD